MQLDVTAPDGGRHRLTCADGITVMEAIRDAGIDGLLALCGGVCSCATCHVHIDPDYAGLLPPISEDESDLLDTSIHRDGTSRLSCQIRMTAMLDGLRLTIAQED